MIALAIKIGKATRRGKFEVERLNAITIAGDDPASALVGMNRFTLAKLEG